MCDGPNRVVCDGAPLGTLRGAAVLGGNNNDRIRRVHELPDGTVSYLVGHSSDGVLDDQGRQLGEIRAAHVVTYGPDLGLRSVEVIARKAYVADMAWAPDGSRYAMLMGYGGESEVVGRDGMADVLPGVLGDQDGFLVRYAADGSIAWVRWLGRLHQVFNPHVLMSSAGDVVVAFDVYVPIELAPGQANSRTLKGKYSVAVLRWSREGELLWISDVSSESTYLGGLAEMPDRDLLLSISVRHDAPVLNKGTASERSITFEGRSQRTELTLIRLDPEGQFVSAFRPLGWGVRGGDVAAMPDGSVVFVGGSGSWSFSENFGDGVSASLFYGRLEANGDLEWLRYAMSFSSDGVGGSLMPTEERGFVLSGGSYGSLLLGPDEPFETFLEGREMALLVRVGGDGDLLWAQASGGGRYASYGAPAVPATGGGFWVAGTFESEGLTIGRCGSEQQLQGIATGTYLLARFDD